MHNAIAGRSAIATSAASPVGDDNLDVLVPQELPDAHLLGGVVLDDQQAFASRCRVCLDLLNRRFQSLSCRGFGDERERAPRETVLSILVERHDLNWNVPCLGIVLQLTQHGPPEHVGQEHVERYGSWTELFGECDRLGATHCHECLQPLIARKVRENAGVVRIVFDNEQCRIARLHVVTIILHDFGGPLWEAHGRESANGNGCEL